GPGQRAPRLPGPGASGARRAHRSARLADWRAPRAGSRWRNQVVLRLAAGWTPARRAVAAGAPPLDDRAPSPRWQARARLGRLSGAELVRAAPSPGLGLPDLVLCYPAGGRAAPPGCGGVFPPGAVYPRRGERSWSNWSSPSPAQAATRASRSPRAPAVAAP